MSEDRYLRRIGRPPVYCTAVPFMHWLDAVGVHVRAGLIQEKTSVLTAVGMGSKLVPVTVQPGTLLSIFANPESRFGRSYVSERHVEGPNYDLLWDGFFDRFERDPAPPIDPGLYVWEGHVTISAGSDMDPETYVEFFFEGGDGGPWPVGPGTWHGPLEQLSPFVAPRYPMVRAEEEREVMRFMPQLVAALDEQRPNSTDYGGPSGDSGWSRFYIRNSHFTVEPLFADCPPGPPFPVRDLIGVNLCNSERLMNNEEEFHLPITASNLDTANIARQIIAEIDR
jgi:hypothetical protein